MHAACVYMACRLEHNPRTFKEILAGAPGTSKVCNPCQCRRTQRSLADMHGSLPASAVVAPRQFWHT